MNRKIIIGALSFTVLVLVSGASFVAIRNQANNPSSTNITLDTQGTNQVGSNADIAAEVTEKVTPVLTEEETKPAKMQDGGGTVINTLSEMSPIVQDMWDYLLISEDQILKFNPTDIKLIDDTSEWIDYENKNLGIKFEYPQSATISENDNEVIVNLARSEEEGGSLYAELSFLKVDCRFNFNVYGTPIALKEINDVTFSPRKSEIFNSFITDKYFVSLLDTNKVLDTDLSEEVFANVTNSYSHSLSDEEFLELVNSSVYNSKYIGSSVSLMENQKCYTIKKTGSGISTQNGANVIDDFGQDILNTIVKISKFT